MRQKHEDALQMQYQNQRDEKTKWKTKKISLWQ